MKVIVKRAGEDPDLNKEFALDDEPFDVQGWIGVYVGGVEVDEVHIRDLYAAVEGLWKHYELSLLEEAARD